jgi:hypothetical protein
MAVARRQDASDRKNQISKNLNAKNFKVVIFVLHMRRFPEWLEYARRIFKQARFKFLSSAPNIGPEAGKKKQQQTVTSLGSHHCHCPSRRRRGSLGALHLASPFVLRCAYLFRGHEAQLTEFSGCTRMANHNLSGAFRATCPQELIDLILGKTDSADKGTLKLCALVARSFRPTSQKLIFSDLTILPPGCDRIPALQRLADVFSASPHLALHVRTLHLVQPGLYQPCVWMQSDILPAILSVFTHLESLKVRIYNWDCFSSNCEQAIYALITRSSLSSIELKEARLQTNARLKSLLRCLPASLESASFLNLFTDCYGRDDPESASAELHQLRLASMHLHSYAPALFHWAIRAVDLKCLRHLHTMVKKNTMNVVQQLLDGAVHVETYHLFFGSIFCACFH